MEWKLAIGQFCMTAVIVVAIFQDFDHFLVYSLAGALATSVGFPFAFQKKEESS